MIQSNTSSSSALDVLLECSICADRKLYKGPRGLKIHCSRRHVPRTDIVSTPDASQGSPSGTSTLGAPINTSLAAKLAQLKRSVKVIKRIPRGARVTVAQSLAECVARVVGENTLSAWENLFTFSYKTLHLGPDSKNRSLTSIIKHNTSRHFIPTAALDVSQVISFRNNNINLIENKVSDGNVRGAAKILFCNDSLATDSFETYAALCDKHPAQSPSTQLPFPPSSETPLRIDEEDTFLSIRSFPNGSAGGLDAVTPQHLKDLTDPFVGAAGKSLLRELTALGNHMLDGQVPEEIVPILFGANLVALTKKDGGIRPIAVGSTFRRLTSKTCCRAIQDHLSKKFLPHQLGFGVRSGCEAAVHAARTFLASTDYEVFIKIDVKNAFNSLDRGVLLSEIQKEAPEIYHYLWQCYGAPSKLLFGQKEIKSCVGCQQGDPLGPALFSLGINSIISELNSEFNIWYLDDGSLGGSASTVLEDLKTIIDRFNSIGLTLNYDKCEIYIPDHIPNQLRSAIIDKFNLLCPKILLRSKLSLNLLGAPIFLDAIPPLITSKIESFKNSSSRLFEIKPHMAIYILRLCLFSPKFMYLLRSCPAWYFQSVVDLVDSTLKNTMTKILNLRFDSNGWAQATLPISFGGLGIRLSSSVALPAFLASSHGSQALIGMILKTPLADVRVAGQIEALAAWCASCPGVSIPTETGRQSAWDIPIIKITHSALLDQQSNDADRARLLAASEVESGHWLRALPSDNLATVLDPSSLRVAVGLRLGLKLCEPHRCQCGQAVDQLGRHGLSCVKSAGRLYRHWAINDLVSRALSTASVPSTLEPAGMVRDDGKRPDGATLVPWCLGRALVWDATCVDTLAPSNITSSARSVGAAAERAQLMKRRKYSQISANYEFFALAVETLGPWSSDTKKFYKDISTRLVLASGDLRAGSYFAQKLSLLIQRGNAASILGTLPHGGALDDVFHL